MKKKRKSKYYQSGVDYTLIDPFKVLMQNLGKTTSKNLTEGFKEIVHSRGESAYVLYAGPFYLALVQEGLGTKNIIADAVYKLTGKSYYKEIAHDTVATIINDLTSAGAKPLAINAYWSSNSYSWFTDNKKLSSDLISGWKEACDLAGCSWGGGETQSLNAIVKEGVVELAGCGLGIIKKDQYSFGEKLRLGDAIILFESSGIHANGISLARKIVKRLPKSYLTKLRNGKSYGQEILKPTILYSKLIQDLFKNKVDLHYLSNLTGHGWRKIMRNKKSFTYVIETLPPIPEILRFIQEKAKLSDKEAYATFNMGAGFAVFVSKKDSEKVLKIAEKHKIRAYLAGKVEKGPKRIIIKPLNITFEGSSFEL